MNGQYRDTNNFGYMTQDGDKKKCKNTTQKTKKMNKTYHTKKPDVNPRVREG